MGAALFPVVGIALKFGLHARLEVLQLVATGSDAVGGVGHLAVFRGHDRNVIVRHDEREVGIAAAQGEDHGVFAVGLNVGDWRNHALGGRFGILAAVVVVGGNHIFSFKAFAVVEFNPFAQFKGPDFCIRCGIPGFCQFRNRFKIMINFNKAVADLITDIYGFFDEIT